MYERNQVTRHSRNKESQTETSGTNVCLWGVEREREREQRDLYFLPPSLSTSSLPLSLLYSTAIQSG